MILTLAGLVAGAAAVGVSLYRLELNGFGSSRGTFDLRVYMAGARAIRSGGALYGAGFAALSPRGFPFTYPPFAAIALVPLSYLGIGPLAWGWDLVSCAVLFGCVRAAFGPLHRRLGSPVTIGVLTCLALLARPVYDDLAFGQVDMLIMGAVMFACAGTRSHPWRATLVGLAAAVKVVPGIFVVYLFLTRRWRMAWAATGTWAAAAALAFALRPGSSVAYYGHLLWQPGRPGTPTSYLNQSLWGMVDRAQLGSLRVPVIAASVGLVAIVGLARSVKDWRRGRPVEAIVTVGLVGVLASPISWLHETVWLVPAVGLLLGDARLRPGSPGAIGPVGRRSGLVGGQVAALALAAILWTSLPAIGNHAGSGIWGQLLMDSYGIASAALALGGFRGAGSAHGVGSGTGSGRGSVSGRGAWLVRRGQIARQRSARVPKAYAG